MTLGKEIRLAREIESDLVAIKVIRSYLRRRKNKEKYEKFAKALYQPFTTLLILDEYDLADHIALHAKKKDGNFKNLLKNRLEIDPSSKRADDYYYLLAKFAMDG